MIGFRKQNQRKIYLALSATVRIAGLVINRQNNRVKYSVFINRQNNRDRFIQFSLTDRITGINILVFY